MGNASAAQTTGGDSTSEITRAQEKRFCIVFIIFRAS
jgi:hypothetical protein